MRFGRDATLISNVFFHLFHRSILFHSGSIKLSSFPFVFQFQSQWKCSFSQPIALLCFNTLLLWVMMTNKIMMRENLEQILNRSPFHSGCIYIWWLTQIGTNKCVLYWIRFYLTPTPYLYLQFSNLGYGYDCKHLKEWFAKKNE